MSDEIIPPETATLRKRRRRRRVALVAAAVLLIAGGVWGVVTISSVCGSLGSGVDEVGGECVGVSDGSYVFHPELAAVQQRIETENARVRAESPGYVTVALLDPLLPDADSALPPLQVRNRLEGAYTALRRVNTESVAGDPKPAIQLLLANGGDTDDQWRRVADRLTELSQEPHPLVAVVGLGVSTDRTRRMAEQLSQRGIPMVGAVLTADDLDYEHIPGLIKASPSNRHYVDALRRYVDSANIRSAIMIRDSNSDSGTDLYTQTLEAAFGRQMRDLITFPTQQFTGKSIPSQIADPNLFANVRANICASAASGLQAVLYAGREVDLGAFIESLKNRTCQALPLTILTAGLELGGLLKSKEQELTDARLKIVSAATVDVEGWLRNEEADGTPKNFRGFRQAFEAAGFPKEHLDDGGAIMMHDAVLTAAHAVRIAAPQGSASAPTAADVRAQLLNINTLYTVGGASGTLSFSKSPSGAGTPVGKPVPVLAYPKPPDSTSRQVGPLYRVPN
ncbi:hypothetical protein [Amycolatopsis anabasis]|uniref:hypothetical protein n=1 Tax=Amycolatopsis anabasis TaxID=1840409 RepID=UPI00131DE598|nr:hypothetical protein [Amycolatopsis anabasis]